MKKTKRQHPRYSFGDVMILIYKIRSIEGLAALSDILREDAFKYSTPLRIDLAHTLAKKMEELEVNGVRSEWFEMVEKLK